ncbi:MAG: sensor histidine kinase [Vulcanimicrobiota bacterium]
MTAWLLAAAVALGAARSEPGWQQVVATSLERFSAVRVILFELEPELVHQRGELGFERARWLPQSAGLSPEGWLVAPILNDDKPLGLIVAAGEADDLDGLRLFGHLAGASLTNLRLLDQLMQSAKLATLGQMTAGVAHELNNPLGAMTLWLDTASMLVDRKPEKAVAQIESALEALERCQRILDNVLHFARKREAHSTEEITLDTLVERVLETLHPNLKRIPQTVELGSRARVEGNSLELQQLLVNLLLNARDALLPVEGPRLWVRTRQQNGRARVEIEDNGPGVGAADAERIFAPFFTTKPPGSGTGLGLSLSREIARSHQGYLTVTGGAQGGALFVLDLPVAEV